MSANPLPCDENIFIKNESVIACRQLNTRLAIAEHQKALSTPLPKPLTAADLDREITLLRWAQKVASAPADEVIDIPDGFTADELELAMLDAMYRIGPVIKGGQGRTDQEIITKATHGSWFLLAFFVAAAAVALFFFLK